MIDNLGDAGVCWRLARQLADLTEWRVRLVIDRPDVLCRIEPALAEPRRYCRSVDVVPWNLLFPSSPVADIVIEAFGCRLPAAYLAAMTARPRAPVWINLEYLSAEAWVESCHTLPSPDPVSGLVKYFYFPGFTPSTGGLLLDESLEALRLQMRHPRNRHALWQRLGIRSDGSSNVLLFCYPQAPVRSLLAAAGHTPGVRWKVPQTVIEQVTDLDLAAHPGVDVLPWLSQDDFDRVLAACDVSFVRGEDSFLRAQGIGRPFVWQPYRQDGGAQIDKLEAFLARYLANASPALDQIVVQFWRAWNHPGGFPARHWVEFLGARDALEKHNEVWRSTLARAGNLAANLATFCDGKL